MAVVPIYHCAKIHSLSSSNKLSREIRVSGLSRFLAYFSFFERIEVCAFISRKLNKLRGPFFTFPDNFTPSILIVKNIPPGGQGSGATAHPKEEAKISELTLFHAAPATKRLDPEVQ